MIEIFTVENVIALTTLTALEIVLGIDNVVFIAILSGKLPKEKRHRARQIGLLAAMGMRIVLLLMIGWIMQLTDKWLVFSVLTIDFEFSWRDLILLIGGLFLIAKATYEIHDKLEGVEHANGSKRAYLSVGVVISQIMAMDLIFSLDSVITAVGMAKELWVMITAVVLAVIAMMIFAKPVSDFVEKHPTLKMLALSFLVLIGVMLVAEGLGQHIQKGYIYFAMAFSLIVELLNLRLRKAARPVTLRHAKLPADSS